jgi:hypothetical protein
MTHLPLRSGHDEAKSLPIGDAECKLYCVELANRTGVRWSFQVKSEPKIIGEIVLIGQVETALVSLSLR